LTGICTIEDLASDWYIQEGGRRDRTRASRSVLTCSGQSGWAVQARSHSNNTTPKILSQYRIRKQQRAQNHKWQEDSNELRFIGIATYKLLLRSPAKTQTPNGPLPNGPPRMDRSQHVPRFPASRQQSEARQLQMRAPQRGVIAPFDPRRVFF
jgi:hypothetical protein